MRGTGVLAARGGRRVTAKRDSWQERGECMKYNGFAYVATAISLCGGGCLSTPNEKPEPVPCCFKIPRLETASIDADANKWGDRGFRVELMPDKSGAVRPVSDFDAKFRLAWNHQGLLVLVTVAHAVITEPPRLEDIWQQDSVEIFVAGKPGATEYYQVSIGPGVSPGQPKPRLVFNERIKTPVPLQALRATVASRKTADGYRLEVLLPWKNLGISTPSAGEQVALQVMVNKSDGRPGNPFNAVWFPNNNTSRDSKSMHVIQLGEETSPPAGVGVSAAYERFRNIHVAAAAGAFAAGKTVSIEREGRVLGTLPLALDASGRAVADLLLPMPPHGDPCLPLEVFLDARPLKTITLPNADELRAEAFVMERIVFGEFDVNSKTFPKCDFAHPDLVETLIGPYALKAHFYDSAGNPATSAETAGQYYAVVDVTPVGGRTLRRFCTLDRQDTWRADAAARELDRQWWVTFKRRFYGLDTLYPQAIVCPVQQPGKAASTLRDGSPSEAGMQKDIAGKLDALCREWERAANEPFSVCVARHGVIFFHHAYGSREGAPISTETQVRTASSGKFLSAILMMELVDQGRVDLDRTIDTYLPALRGVPCRRQPTVRDLYLHVTGLPGQLGDDRNDIEELVAACYPEIRDVRQSYQNTGLALGGKIVEMISGEVQPAFCRKHLLEPLGCRHTQPGNTAAGVLTTTGDLAIIGQMTLNGGAYGSWRFLQEQTVRQFAPQAGRERIGPDKGIRWGIGTKLYDSDALSAAAFGHPGANGDFILVDPARDLVATMLRWSEGRDYMAFRARLFAMIYEGIADATPGSQPSR